MNSEESTLKTISPEQPDLDILYEIQNRVFTVENRLDSLINKTKSDSLTDKVIEQEIQIANLESLAYEFQSVSNLMLARVHSLRGEMRDLRAESAFRNQEFERLEKLVS